MRTGYVPAGCAGFSQPYTVKRRDLTAVAGAIGARTNGLGLHRVRQSVFTGPVVRPDVQVVRPRGAHDVGEGVWVGLGRSASEPIRGIDHGGRARTVQVDVEVRAGASRHLGRECLPGLQFECVDVVEVRRVVECLADRARRRRNARGVVVGESGSPRGPPRRSGGSRQSPQRRRRRDSRCLSHPPRR